MKSLKKSHWILIIFSVLVLAGCIGITAFLLFSNYQNVRLFKQAQDNFLRGEPDSLIAAEAQFQQVIRLDKDNEAAYIMLGKIAHIRKIYPEQVYYCYMAHRLNPLSNENKEQYIRSLWFARYFDRLENFLSQQHDLTDEWNQLLFYAAGRNGNLKKYKLQLERRDNNNGIAELAFLLFKYNHLSISEKLAALQNIRRKETDFLKQELLAAEAELHLDAEDIDNAEKALKQAYELNAYAFAPALGRFYANFRTLGQALPVFEKHLATYHDPVIALQAAELYCLLGRSSDIEKLRTQYQSDSGSSSMLLCYYFDALNALINNDTPTLKELLVPLRGAISTPLALYLFLCSDIHEKNVATILENYTALLNRRNYVNLQFRADDLVSHFLKKNLAEFRGSEEKLLPLATRLYSRKKEAFTAKYILLAQKKRNAVDIALLKDALKRFNRDHGIVKIAIEHFLGQDLAESERLIAYYKQNFPQKSADMLRYEIVLASRKNDFDRVSKLFRSASSPAIRAEYWNFASATMRKDDLLFLSKDPLYAPFAQALLLIQSGNPNAACELLEKADHQGNAGLLFFSARTLAENGRNNAALQKYAQFPENSPYQLDVLLNTAELYAENGNHIRALELSEKAYKLAPDLPEAQLCYADKLRKSGYLTKIPDVVKPTSPNSQLRQKLRNLWIIGMQQRIRECAAKNMKEKTRELCRQLLTISPYDNTALEALQKCSKMPQ